MASASNGPAWLLPGSWPHLEHDQPYPNRDHDAYDPPSLHPPNNLSYPRSLGLYMPPARNEFPDALGLLTPSSRPDAYTSPDTYKMVEEGLPSQQNSGAFVEANSNYDLSGLPAELNSQTVNPRMNAYTNPGTNHISGQSLPPQPYSQPYTYSSGDGFVPRIYENPSQPIAAGPITYNQSGYHQGVFRPTQSHPIIDGESTAGTLSSPARPNAGKRVPTVVAVFGKTGTGKTSFIQSVTGLDLKAGHNLASSTQTLETYPYRIGNEEILLVDTPGFDDTNLSDTDILTMIADWLEKTYDEGSLLSGIVYLHKISDNRMDGASMKSLRLFRKLCGESNLHNVILGTTMWANVDDATGTQRETELRDIYWKDMVAQGSTMRRISTNEDDTKILVESFLPKTPFVAQLQQELKSGKSLPQTEAAAALRDEMDKLTKRYEKDLQSTREEMREANRKQNAKLQQELKAELEAINEKLLRVTEEKTKLQNTISSGRLPKQQRSFFSGRWPCLGKCGRSALRKGRWTCKVCKITQKNE